MLVVNRRTAKRFVSTAITSFGRTKNTVFIVEVVFFLKFKGEENRTSIAVKFEHFQNNYVIAAT